MNTEATINIAIDRLLFNHKRSFYWLSKETGISYTTLWRLKKGKALGINFTTLVKICDALNCDPGDLLTISTQDQLPKESSRRRTAARSKVDQ
jgi:putative transcriptional regulator